MAHPILVPPDVQIPGEAIAMKAVRSGGPGGQNVNKVASKVELRINLEAIEGLDSEAQTRLRHAVRNRLDAEGRWIITSDKTRDQAKNLEDAREKAARILAEALVAPIPRRPTRPTRASKARRLGAKRAAGEKKRLRGGRDFE
jgi:ribosome-associated protein